MFKISIPSLQIPSLSDTLELASSVAQATLRFVQQAGSLFGRIGKVAGYSIIAISAAFCAQLAYPAAVVGFVAHWIMPNQVEQIYKTLIELFSDNIAHSFLAFFIAFLCLPATIILAAFTYGVALHVFWNSDEKQLKAFWEKL